MSALHVRRWAAAQGVMLLATLIHHSLRQVASPPIAVVWRGGQPCVAASVGEGRRIWLLLDTGARRSSLNRSARDRLIASGVTVADEGSIVLPDLTVGGFSLGSRRLETGDAEERPVEGAEGCLGLDVLGEYQIGLDLREKTLRLWAAGDMPRDWFTGPPESRISLGIEERPEGRTIPVTIANLTVPMVIDTGAADTFLHSEIASLLKGARKAKGGDVTLRFYDGRHHVRVYTVPSVGLGGVDLGEHKIGVAGVTRMVGLLGRDLFGSLKVLLDYPRGQAIFAGIDGVPLSVPGGPSVDLPNGVVVRYGRGEKANAPPGCAYSLPPGYREVFRTDESVDLIPPRA